MTKSHRSALFVLAAMLAFVALVATSSLRAKSAPAFHLVNGDRVVFLGDTFFERAQRYGWLETALQLRFPRDRIQFRNLGWSGDTVFAESRGIFDSPAKGYEQMLQQVRDTKPTVIVLNYGGNESFNGPEYIETFVRQYGKLLDDLSSTRARIVLVSPLPLFKAGSPLPDPTAHNMVRKQFVGAVQKLARQRSLKYVDLWSPIEKRLYLFGPKYMSEEGVHLTDAGYSVVSKIFARALAGDSFSKLPSILLDHDSVPIKDASPFKVEYTVNDSERRFKTTLPANPQVCGVRMSAGALKPGTYEVRSNDVLRGVMTSEQIELSAMSEFGSVGLLDVEELRQKIVEKNEMYFRRWRPQNVTYLFLFRKHEQGNNAKEVDEFLPIIARLEKRIFELKAKPRKINVEIVRKSVAEN